MGMHATKDRVESDTSTVYSISLYESTITTRDEPWFGELKLALGVIGLPVTLGKNGEVHPNRPMKNKRRAKRQWRAKRMRNGHGEKEVWRRSSRAHSLRFLGPKQCKLTPVQCLAELRGFNPYSLSSSSPRLTGPYLFRGRVEPREALLRGRSLAPLHSLQGSKPFFNIGDKERGRDGRDQTRNKKFRKGRGTQTFFAQSSITINGWLRDFLWAQASQVIQSYGSSLSAYGLFFLGAHFVWAFSLMFLFSGRGYWQELIESIVWAHNKLKVAPATQPRALSIVQGRAVGVTHYLLGGIATTWAFFLARIIAVG
ncbi:hypothetical protein OSB04_un000929 [Centaurea solstitialis]|uniref:Photosystem I P700 apoprotein A1 n=1 Tax=Centaurea solstitialis TaxID=347529 RepID=A0AA38SPL1_9ASTR|nr:hypothetical protein OSB04_un000929 [Centaurea solstitialis]